MYLYVSQVLLVCMCRTETIQTQKQYRHTFYKDLLGDDMCACICMYQCIIAYVCIFNLYIYNIINCLFVCMRMHCMHASVYLYLFSCVSCMYVHVPVCIDSVQLKILKYPVTAAYLQEVYMHESACIPCASVCGKLHFLNAGKCICYMFCMYLHVLLVSVFICIYCMCT
jgi:hypothetical protein